MYGKVIDGSGNMVKSEFRINKYTSGNQYNQKILVLSNGNVLITWMSNLQDGSGYGVYAKVIDGSVNTV